MTVPPPNISSLGIPLLTFRPCQLTVTANGLPVVTIVIRLNVCDRPKSVVEHAPKHVPGHRSRGYANQLRLDDLVTK